MFGVLLSELAVNPESKWVRSALEGLNSIAPLTGSKVSEALKDRELSYKVIPIVGSKGSIAASLISALSNLCENNNEEWISKSFAARVSRCGVLIRNGSQENSEIATLYSLAAQQAVAAGHKGLLILIDEFGQFLEYAASNESSDNLLLVQLLAEESSRAKDNSLLLLTFLHQSVVHYSKSGDSDHFTEWQKVQGRFREIAFNEDPDNQYELIHGAVAEFGDIFDAKSWARRIKKQASQIELFSSGPSGEFWSQSVSRFAPLHPVTVFALPRLSSIVGQNQRTLFGFIESGDPKGLRGILDSPTFRSDTDTSVTADQLFDFFLRPANPISMPDDARRRVAEANAALDRLGDRPTLESRIIKSLTVLSVIQPGTRLLTDGPTLAFSLNVEIKSAELSEALEQLISRKLVVFRKFSSEFKLWQGTDFNADQAIQHITDELQHDEVINNLLDPGLKPKLVSARRHAFVTGTSRALSWVIADAAEITRKNYSVPEADDLTKDGTAFLVLTQNRQQAKNARIWAENQRDKNLVIFVSTNPTDLPTHIKTLAASRKAEDVFPVISEDHVARAEITARIDHHSSRVSELFDRLFNDRSSIELYWSGQRQEPWESLPLTEVASRVFDRVYDEAPVIKNELVNKQDISPTGFAAVKKTIEALLTGTSEYRAGFEGHGAEVSVLRSVFEDTGLFRKSGKFGLKLMNPPSVKHDRSKLGPVWEHISKWSKDPNNSPSGREAPFVRLLDELTAPPFGVKRGLALILIWSFVMVRKDEIALYDNGTYATDWTAEDFDRFMKHPEFYSLQWFSARGKTATAFATQ